MAWIEVHQSLPGHRKTLQGAYALKIGAAQMTGHMVHLWLWALDSAPDGALPPERGVIAHAAGWTKDPDSFIDTLVRVGFLDEADGGALHVHNWDDYVGRLIAKRVANVERMRRARAANDTRTVHERAGATVPNQETDQGEDSRRGPSSPSRSEQSFKDRISRTDKKPEQIAILIELVRARGGQVVQDAGGRAAALLGRASDPVRAVSLVWAATMPQVEGEPFQYAMGIISSREVSNGSRAHGAGGHELSEYQREAKWLESRP